MNNKKQHPPEIIEILSVSLLDENRELVSELKKLASSLQLEFGWHYLLDLCWIIRNLGEIAGKHILDAGAGTGILQWYLAEHAATVISVDRIDRTNLAYKFRKRFQAQAFQENRPGKLASFPQTILANTKATIGFRQKLSYLIHDLTASLKLNKAIGKVLVYDHDLSNLEGIPDNSIDAVASLSALEHNDPEHLQIVVKELLRVIKPGGQLLATLGASRDRDWFHRPSHGWCYSETTLKRVFDLSKKTASNYHQYDELFELLYDCTELRKNLAKFYFRSGDNGMPWGIWEPHYQSVGILKTKLA